MSWLDTKKCPICGSEDFDPDCDEVDIGVGVQEFNFRGRCTQCGEVAACQQCGFWLSEHRPRCECLESEERGVAGKITTSPRLPMRDEPWPKGYHETRPCPICEKPWVPWAGSYLPCHARCLFTTEEEQAMLADSRTNAQLAAAYRVSESAIRSVQARARAERRRRASE